MCTPFDVVCGTQCFCFQNLIKYFLDTSIQKKYFFKEFFKGELTDISAKTEALVATLFCVTFLHSHKLNKYQT